ncbi:MAG: hypothetical protein FWF23_02485 [Alphaproteobacteria bacterium]|nr:hypothetical protein [Alphaproteobacteria bacterium]MCL2505823.1 hypothetical protein [Alphaproteobacteria bacterium]
MEKENYYKEVTLVNKKLSQDSKVTACPCQRKGCEWHGNCKACVSQHTYMGSHVPVCQQLTSKNIIRAIASKMGIELKDKPETPPEYRYYSKEKYERDCAAMAPEKPEDKVNIPPKKIHLSVEDLMNKSMEELLADLAATVEMEIKKD